MQKATTIKEIYNLFQPERTITRDTKEFYVDIFKKSLKEFALDLEMQQIRNKTFLVAGQSGNGKSSALNMLSIDEMYPEVNDLYDFKYIVGRKNFEYLPKIDVADILFNIAFTIIEDDDELHNEFVASLERLEKLFNADLEEKIAKTNNSDAKLQLGSQLGIGGNILGLFKAKTDFKASYSLSDEAVKSATEFFKFKKQELIQLVNDIILSYEAKFSKKIIVVIDDLEKRKDVNHLFINSHEQNAQLPILNQLNLTKIITMPIHIVRSNYVNFGDLKEFGLKLKKSDGSDNLTDKQLLREVILRRVSKPELLDEDALKRVIENSGANMNQLISLIHKAALEAMLLESDTIGVEEIDKVSEDLRRILSSYVMNQRTFLNKIATNNIAIDDEKSLEDLEKAISNNVVFAYFNGATWFEINPIVKESLRFYNDKADTPPC